MSRDKKKSPFIIHPFLFALFPTLFLFSYNIGKIPPGAVFAPMAVIIFFSSFAFFLLYFLFMDREKAGLLVSLSLLFFFSYGHISKMIELAVSHFVIGRFSIGINGILFPLWGTLFFIAIYLSVKTRRNLSKTTRFLNVVGSLLIITSLVNIGSFAANAKGIPEGAGRKEGEVNVFEGREGIYPNIYFIILDGYARADVLKDMYDHDNAEFIDYLTKKGFYVTGRSAANYCQTALTLASSFNLGYLDELAEDVGIDSYDHRPLRYAINNSLLFSFLKDHGYDIAAFFTGQIDTVIWKADMYITPGWIPDEFQSELINTTPIPAVLYMLKAKNQFDLHRNKLLYILDHLADTCRLTPPVFVFAHIEAPHPPFVFGREGEKIKLHARFDYSDGNWLIRDGGFTKEEYVRAYRDQLIFINTKVKRTIDEILSRSKRPPIIILQADHGPRSMLNWEDPAKTNFKESMSILNAYYLPDDGHLYLYDEITPVNTFRIILNHYFGASYKLLEDRNFFSTAKRPYRFIDVTEEIK